MKNTKNSRWRAYARGSVDVCERQTDFAVSARSDLTTAPKDVKTLECIRPHKELPMGERYAAAVEKENKEFYIFDESNEKFIKKQMEYIDGFMRIHMEIIYNAIDNIPRSREQGLICDMIKIEINEKLNKISVTNNGLSIPITQNNKN